MVGVMVAGDLRSFDASENKNYIAMVCKSKFGVIFRRLLPDFQMLSWIANFAGTKIGMCA